jgi:uncharacterized protein YkwD
MDMEMDKRQVAVDAAVRHEREFSVMVCSVYARPRAARRPWRRLIPRALALTLLATMLPVGRLITTVQPAAAATGPRPTVVHLACSQRHLPLGPRRPATLPATTRPGASVAARVSASTAQMLALINAERAQAGAGPLRFDATLTAIAQARSQDMLTRHYFSHQIPGRPGVHRVFDVLDRAHVSYHIAGENIALNNYSVCFALPRTMQQTNSDLMHSPEHRANLLKRQYTEVGLGLAFEPPTGRLILTEVFLQP